MNIWLIDLTYDQQFIAADTVPLSIGTLASYCQHFSKRPITTRLFKYPGRLIEAIESGPLPDVAGFSNFIWNSRFNLHFARILRERKPSLPIVFGGLHYPNETITQEQWLRKHPGVDFYVVKEGENGFLRLIEALDEYSAKAVKAMDISGVHYIRPSGEAHIVPPAERVRDLASFPSPYLSGMLDEFLDGKLMPLITTNRGCPFTCTFCSEGTLYYNKISRSNVSRVAAEFDYIAQKIADPEAFPQRNIYITDSNFGMYPEDIEICHAIRETKHKYGWPEYIHTTTGKNNKERVLSVARLLEGGMRLSGSVQSLDPVVTKNIRRDNIKADQLLAVALEAATVGANTYSEIILGLPGDTFQAHEHSIRTMVNARYDYVVTHQLAMLPDSEVAQIASRERFGLKTKWRILTKSYGDYAVSDHSRILSAEVEEICVANKSMDFEEYLEARRLNFVLAIFYNDRLLSGFLTVLDMFGIPRYDWVRWIFDSVAQYEIFDRQMEAFIRETKAELYDSEDELVDFVSHSEVIHKLLDGELGANLLAKYRIVLVTENMHELSAIARDATKALLRQRNLLTLEMDEFLNEVALFEFEKKRNAFDLVLDDSVRRFSYDIARFLNDANPQEIRSYRFREQREITFTRPRAVTDVIKRNHRVYGSTRSGIYKQTTRTPVKQLYRVCEGEETARQLKTL